MTDTSMVISDRLRKPITATRREDGGLVIRCAGRGSQPLLLGPSEVARLVEFVTPQLGRLERFPIARTDGA